MDKNPDVVIEGNKITVDGYSLYLRNPDGSPLDVAEYVKMVRNDREAASRTGNYVKLCDPDSEGGYLIPPECADFIELIKMRIRERKEEEKTPITPEKFTEERDE